MNTIQQLTVDQASRLAVTAAAADLEEWAREATVDGRVGLDDLLEVLAVLRADSIPHSSTELPLLAAS